MLTVPNPQMQRVAELEGEVVEAAAVLSCATARFLDAVRAFDEEEAWGLFGHRSCAEWLSWRVGMVVPTGREYCRVARALGDLPAIDAALHAGRLSYSKVRAMTRVATAANEGELLDLAGLSTASQLERICRGYREVRREVEGEGWRDEAPERRVDWYWDRGMLVVRACLPADEGELVLQALRAGRDSLHAEASGAVEAPAPAGAEAGDGRGPDVSAEASLAPSGGPGGDVSAEAPACRPTLADALCAMAETTLRQGLAPVPGGARTRVVVHLRPAAGGVRAHLDEGGALCLDAALRLACDAQLVPVVDDERGRTLDVGRARRTVPSAIRRALRLRDGGCRFPGCNCRRFVDAHHVVHWARGGETRLDNLVLLCRFHHGLLHEGGFAVRAEPDGGFAFFDPRGRRLPDSPTLRPAVAGWVPGAPERPEPGPGREPWDCGWAIHGLLRLDGVA